MVDRNDDSFNLGIRSKLHTHKKGQTPLQPNSIQASFRILTFFQALTERSGAAHSAALFLQAHWGIPQAWVAVGVIRAVVISLTIGPAQSCHLQSCGGTAWSVNTGIKVKKALRLNLMTWMCIQSSQKGGD